MASPATHTNSQINPTTTPTIRWAKLGLIAIVFAILGIFVVAQLYFGAELDANNRYPQFIISNAKTLWYRIQYVASGASSFSAGVNSFFSPMQSFDNSATSSKSIPVLVYHGVVNKNDGTGINITTQRFKEQMFALKHAGYRTITLDQLLRFKEGTYEPPPKSMVITFDDGRADSYYNANPILQALGYHAAMFVITNYSFDETAGGGFYLDAAELHRLVNSSTWEIGAHAKAGHAPGFLIGPNGAMGHFYGNKLWLPALGRYETDAETRARLTAEFTGAKNDLKNTLGVTANTYAFPFGDYGQNYTNAPSFFPGHMRSIVTGIYTMLFYQTYPGKYYDQTYSSVPAAAPYFIKRIELTQDVTGSSLVTKLENSSAKSLPYTDTFSSNKGWVSSWGSYTLDTHTGTLRIQPQQNDTGASVVLDGSYPWKDYLFSANVRSPAHTSVYLWARFADANNNAGCNFGANFVHIEQTVGGTNRVIQGVNQAGLLPQGVFTASIAVSGRTIECLINGSVVAQSNFLDPSLGHGGIGLKAWDKTPDLASLIVNHITVTSFDTRASSTAATTGFASSTTFSSS